MKSLIYLPFLSEYHKSIEFSSFISSLDSEKLKTSKFSSILFGFTDFGITITPRWTCVMIINLCRLNNQFRETETQSIFRYEIHIDITCHLSRICAGLLPLRFAISSTLLSLSKGSGSFGSLKGLSGDPSGLNPVISIPCFSQNSFNFDWLRYGWHSTWFMAGTIWKVVWMIFSND